MSKIHSLSLYLLKLISSFTRRRLSRPTDHLFQTLLNLVKRPLQFFLIDDQWRCQTDRVEVCGLGQHPVRFHEHAEVLCRNALCWLDFDRAHEPAVASRADRLTLEVGEVLGHHLPQIQGVLY